MIMGSGKNQGENFKSKGEARGTSRQRTRWGYTFKTSDFREERSSGKGGPFKGDLLFYEGKKGVRGEKKKESPRLKMYQKASKEKESDISIILRKERNLRRGKEKTLSKGEGMTREITYIHGEDRSRGGTLSFLQRKSCHRRKERS